MIAAAISSGWIAFAIGVVIAVVLVALLGHLDAGHRGAPVAFSPERPTGSRGIRPGRLLGVTMRVRVARR